MGKPMVDDNEQSRQAAYLLQRRQALPEQQPKSPSDDPDAPEAIRRIMENPAYREADQDLDLLQEEETRGFRLQLEYLKAETALRRYGVAHTIVVFGSTRLEEPKAADRHFEECTRQLIKAPADEELRRRHAVAERLREKSRYYDIAREFGRIVGRKGKETIGGRTLIMTGGGPGIMEAANRGAHDVGAPSIGFNITLPQQQFPNPYVTSDLCLRFRYFALRKLHFALRARGLVVFPGGYGTMDELFEVLELSQTRKMAPVPVILVGRSFWQKAFDPEFLVAEGVIEPEDRDLFWFAEGAEEIWNGMLRWHEARGTPLLARDAHGA